MLMNMHGILAYTNDTANPFGMVILASRQLCVCTFDAWLCEVS